MAVSTVIPEFKNPQDKNLFDFQNQIIIYQLVIYVVNYSQDKVWLTNLICIYRQVGVKKLKFANLQVKKYKLLGEWVVGNMNQGQPSPCTSTYQQD